MAKPEPCRESRADCGRCARTAAQDVLRVSPGAGLTNLRRIFSALFPAAYCRFKIADKFDDTYYGKAA